MKKLWKKILAAWTSGKRNKAARLEYKMLKRTLKDKKETME